MRRHKHSKAPSKLQAASTFRVKDVTVPSAVSLRCDVVMDLTAAADGQPAKRPTFTIDAYSGGPLRVAGFYRPVVIDLAGLRANNNVPILLDHDASQIVGQASKVEVKQSSIKLTGTVTGDDAPAVKVVGHAKNGFQWSASVGVGIDRLESVGENTNAKVNGQTIAGPILIVRAGRLNEVSFVAVGADENAAATVAARAAEGFTMNFNEWLKAKAFDVATLTDDQTATLKAAYDAELKAGAVSKPDESKEGETVTVNVKASVDTSDVEASVAEYRKQISAETQRVSEIRKACAGKHADIEAKAISEGWTSTKAELEVLRAERPNVPAVRGDRQETSGPAIEAALCMSAGISEAQVGKWYDQKVMNAALGREMRAAGIHMLMYHVLQAAGRSMPFGRVGNDTIHAAFEADRQLRAAAGFSTVSLSGILSAVANKALLSTFLAFNSVVSKIAAETDNSDFKTFTRYRLTGTGSFEKVGPGGELKSGGLSEEPFTSKVDTYGEIITLTREQIINDDLGAFLDIPKILGRKSAVTRERALFILLLSNPSSFFSTGNNNYIEGAGTALSIAALSQAEQVFLDQVDSAGDPVVVTPATLLVGSGLKTTAEQLYKETRVNEAATAGSPKPASNPHAGKFEPVASPFLNNANMPGYSTTAWYLLANPAEVATMEVAYLRGQRQPTIESAQTDFATLGMQWRGYFDFGVAMRETRGGVKSKGAA